MRKLSTPCLLLLLLVVAASPAFAVPAIPTPTEVTQPDGTVLEVQIKGDEHQNWMELQPTGHTIVRNGKTSYWEYAERSPDGTLRGSGIKAEPRGRNAPPFIPPRVKPSKNQELEERMLDPRALAPSQEGDKAPAASGTRKALILLVNFSNRSLVTTPGGWYGKLFDTTPGVKSMTNFFSDNSFGALRVAPAAHTQPGNPPGVITVTVPDSHPDYGGYISDSADRNVANQALAQAASYVDFSSFDTNGDHTLQPEELAIYFIFAGYEAAGSYKRPSVWAHAWGYLPITAGSERVAYWALNGELSNIDAQHPVGVVVHELGHAFLNLIDLYDTSGTNEGLGHFSAMAGGSWGADIGEDYGTTPTNLDAWSRQTLGWTVPVEPARGALSMPAPLSSSTAAVKLSHPAVRPQEYYLVENKQPVGWDRGLRALIGADWQGGLLVLHVDDAVASNYYLAGSHQKVVPVQASTSLCDMLLPGSRCRGDATTLFYQGNNDAWTTTTSPNSIYYGGLQSGFSLTKISPPLGAMTALYHPDSVPPTVTAFSVPATSTTLTVPVTTLVATDNIGVAEYLVNESPATPAETDPSWSATVPGSYTFSGSGLKTIYAWARDAAGSISTSRSATVSITGGDSTPPTVTAFTVPATSSSLTVSVTSFAATDNVGVTGYLVNESAARPAAGDPGWRGSAPTSYTCSGAGPKTLYAWARDAAGNVSNSVSANVTVVALPGPWGTQDVGSVGLTGSASYLNGTFTIRGGGADIWGSADGFRFVYQAMTGDGAVTARVVSMQYTHSYAKAGVMMRQALTANSIHAMMDITPGNGAEFSRRNVTGGATTASAFRGVAAPYWVRLVRSGNTFTGYISSNGTTWQLVGSSTIAMGSTIYVGLVTSSHNLQALCTATLDSVAAPLSDTIPPIVTTFTIPATSASLTVPISTLTVSDNVGVTGYLVKESAPKPAPSDPGWSATLPTSYTFATAGTKTLYAWGKDAAGNVSDSRTAMVTVAGGLPSPWGTQDIGSVGVAGSASYLNGIFTIRGGGADIWGSVDAFRFVYQTLSGDGEIVARVASQQNTNSYAKAGIMFRQSLAPDAMHAMMDLTPAAGAQFIWRTATGGGSTVSAVTGIAAPYWIKLVRSGNTFTGYISSDGATWRSVGSSSIPVGSSLYVGLAVTSHNTAALSAVTMDRVTVSGGPTVSPTATITSPASGSTYTAPATIPITATATPGSGATVRQVEFYAGSTLIGTATATPYSVSWTNVAAGSYSLTAVVTDTLGKRGASAPVAVTVAPLPAPWGTADIGSVGLAGSASYLNGVFTMRGSGADIWGSSDAFRFVYKPMTGDGEIIARVSSLQNTHGYAKGGVMIRESLAAGSKHALMDLTPSYGAEFLRRTTTGGTTVSSKITGIAAPYWVRLVRSGSTFTGYVSSNGITWTQVGSSTIGMNSTVYVGLVVSSHNNSALCTATLDGVR